MNASFVCDERTKDILDRTQICRQQSKKQQHQQLSYEKRNTKNMWYNIGNQASKTRSEGLKCLGIETIRRVRGCYLYLNILRLDELDYQDSIYFCYYFFCSCCCSFWTKNEGKETSQMVIKIRRIFIWGLNSTFKKVNGSDI